MSGAAARPTITSGHRNDNLGKKTTSSPSILGRQDSDSAKGSTTTATRSNNGNLSTSEIRIPYSTSASYRALGQHADLPLLPRTESGGAAKSETPVNILSTTTTSSMHIHLDVVTDEDTTTRNSSDNSTFVFYRKDSNGSNVAACREEHPCVHYQYWYSSGPTPTPTPTPTAAASCNDQKWNQDPAGRGTTCSRQPELQSQLQDDAAPVLCPSAKAIIYTGGDADPERGKELGLDTDFKIPSSSCCSSTSVLDQPESLLLGVGSWMDF